MRGEAKRRNKPWRIPLAAFVDIIQKDCFYCGKKPSCRYYSRSAKRVFKYHGMDRVQNNYGYFIGNVVPCCTECNRMKSDSLTAEETLAAALAIKKVRKSKK